MQALIPLRYVVAAVTLVLAVIALRVGVPLPLWKFFDPAVVKAPVEEWYWLSGGLGGLVIVGNVLDRMRVPFDRAFAILSPFIVTAIFGIIRVASFS